jgi:hypothetical protein
MQPNAPRHSTFKQGEYRLDVVYHTGLAQAREAARREVAQASQSAGVALTPYKEC